MQHRTFLYIALILFTLSVCANTKKSEADKESVSDKAMTQHIENKHVKNQEVVIEKELTYTQHTLADTYPYQDTVRVFQWNKIKNCLATTDSLRDLNNNAWAVLQNKKNINGEPPLTKIHHKNEYKSDTDNYGIDRKQSVPLYAAGDLETPERYDYDGSLVKILETQNDFVRVQTTNFQGDYFIPIKYIHSIEGIPAFAKVIVVDRHNQNIATFEKVGDVWRVRSMNPCTTGAHHPPMEKPTPLGLFVIQQKEEKMEFYVDGTTRIEGYAPWANRFCDGAYLHGVPVDLPHTKIIEFSPTLGTIPRSHMCVRNAASHAKFIYDNFPIDESLVYVIE
ncbi:MAG: L,D-transpeptidase [Dysgonamonadaceae bacterium]|jgi:hypothetical protein|nr:L,D-transpeptidase [Dysgonamonadaceae bacterium]